MKYITLFMLICLFFTVRTQEEGNEEENELDCPNEEKACKDFKEKDGYNCCWFKGKYEGQEQKGCTTVKMEDFEKTFEDAKEDYDDLSLDCSGKYLYVASLLLLFFVF